MPHARVLDFLQNVAHSQRKPEEFVSNDLLSPPSRSPFHGLLIAILAAACFWVGLVLLILRLR